MNWMCGKSSGVDDITADHFALLIAVVLSLLIYVFSFSWLRARVFVGCYILSKP